MWPHHHLTALLYLYMNACKCQLFTDEGSHRLPICLNYCISVLASATNRSKYSNGYRYATKWHYWGMFYAWENKLSAPHKAVQISSPLALISLSFRYIHTSPYMTGGIGTLCQALGGRKQFGGKKMNMKRKWGKKGLWCFSLYALQVTFEYAAVFTTLK